MQDQDAASTHEDTGLTLLRLFPCGFHGLADGGYVLSQALQGCIGHHLDVQLGQMLHLGCVN